MTETKTTAIQPAQQPTPSFGAMGLVIKDFTEMQRVAMAFVASGYFSNVRDVAQACVKIQLGAELGIPPVSAMQAFHVVDGKATMSSNLIAALIKRSGRYRYTATAWDDTQCVLDFKERIDGEWVECGSASFTIKDAERAGVANRTPWQKFPKAMLFARALTQGARAYCADVFHGSSIYTEEELTKEKPQPQKRISEERPDVEYDDSEEGQRPTRNRWPRNQATQDVDAEPSK